MNAKELANKARQAFKKHGLKPTSGCYGVMAEDDLWKPFGKRCHAIGALVVGLAPIINPGLTAEKAYDITYIQRDAFEHGFSAGMRNKRKYGCEWRRAGWQLGQELRNELLDV